MSKAILTSFAILCLLSLLFLTECKLSVKASSTTWIVDKDGTADFKTIQEAINNATSGDTIFVHSGTYNEHVIVNETVSLVGEDRDSTIIDGNETGSVVKITANNVSIEGFAIKNSGTHTIEYDSGIFVDHSSGNNISHNMMINNDYGISLYSSINNVVSGNMMINNDYGISLYSSINNVVSGNTITNNYEGISLYYSVNNVVSYNIISSNNYEGISLYYSVNNLLSYNTIINNYAGMYLALYSSNNTIYLNNFNNTLRQVWSGSANIWDNGLEGNYWSNFNGPDSDGDGIIDIPYIINENNTDNYPLMGILSVFNVTSERETYHVTIICNSTISEFRFEIGLETGSKIICFSVTDEHSTVGFCRVRIPNELMNYPYIVLVDAEEIVATKLNVSSETHAYLYFTYIHGAHTIRIISSKTLHIYYELLDKYDKLQTDLYNLNVTYYDLLNSYGFLLGNYSQLQESYHELNHSYQEHLSDYSQNVCNIQNLMYIFAATTAIFIMTTIYLSKHRHASNTKVFEDKKQHTF